MTAADQAIGTPGRGLPPSRNIRRLLPTFLAHFSAFSVHLAEMHSRFAVFSIFARFRAKNTDFQAVLRVLTDFFGVFFDFWPVFRSFSIFLCDFQDFGSQTRRYNLSTPPHSFFFPCLHVIVFYCKSTKRGSAENRVAQHRKKHPFKMTAT
ncbi:MAG: hypothetical protein PHP44_05815 [Kiritimatiellae bacterium]|nr:hypothetical protein [Kiritimatiellia bacterium]